MTKKIIFISFDGKEFATERACCEYEMAISDTKGVLSALKKINKICKSQRTCKNCKFSFEDGLCLLREDVPEDWDLEEIQKRIGG